MVKTEEAPYTKINPLVEKERKSLKEAGYLVYSSSSDTVVVYEPDIHGDVEMPHCGRVRSLAAYEIDFVEGTLHIDCYVPEFLEHSTKFGKEWEETLKNGKEVVVTKHWTAR